MACPVPSDEEIEMLEEVELSSDEESDDDEVSLIVLKRPPAVVRKVQDVEVRYWMLSSLLQLLLCRWLTQVQGVPPSLPRSGVDM